ncbi:MAG: T9SS type A sorting domain-containing protein [Saprospiraceae bacterium]|nr:T9SS type A sorting domain-containing protein [Saprospiraceae bacterium]
MNFKLIYRALFSMLFCVAVQNLNSQITTAFTTDETWLGYSEADVRNLTALPYNTIFGGPWGQVVENAALPGQCILTNLTHPGPPIFSPGNAICLDEDAILTSYFRKDFALLGRNAPLCTATIRVRADNNFRVYVDGTLILPQFDHSSCGGNWAYEDLSGWNWLTIYTIDIKDYINLALETHTILFEVGNCDYINYLAASITITQELDCTPNPYVNHNFTSTDAGTYLNISGLGLDGCYTHEDWRVYYTPNPNTTPYSLLYSVDNLNAIKRPGAARQIALPEGCNWYRIYHRVRYTKCDGTVVQRETLIGPFYYCTPFNGGGLAAKEEAKLDDASGVSTSDLQEEETADLPFKANSKQVVPELLAYPNPAHSTLTVVLPDVESAERIRLTDLQGRTVFEQQAPEQHLEIDCSAFPSGIYILHVVYPSRDSAVKKVQISH